MLQTVLAIVRDGHIELLEQVPLRDGTQLLVTFILRDDDQAFWLSAGQTPLEEVWGNNEDDVFAELLTR